MVGPLAEGGAERDHGRADAALVDPGAGRAAHRSTPSGRGGGWPIPAGRRRTSAGSCLAPRAAGGRARAAGRPALQRPADRRHRRGVVVPLRRGGRLARRPAGDGRHEPDLHLRPAAGPDRDPRLPGGDARADERPAAGGGGGAAVRGVAGRRLDAGHAGGAEPHPPRLRRASAAARARPADGGDREAGRDRARVRARQPDPGRRLADLLAVRLAVAGAGHADRPHRRGERASTSGADAPGRRRRAAGVRRAGGVGAARVRDAAGGAVGPHRRARPGQRARRPQLRLGSGRSRAAAQRARAGGPAPDGVLDRRGRPALGPGALLDDGELRPRGVADALRDRVDHDLRR